MSVVADGGAGPRVQATDGHQWTLLVRQPTEPPRMHLLWLPALGVAARHYLPFAEALAARGVAVYLHEWRGNGSSSLRPSHTQDWGYRELLELDSFEWWQSSVLLPHLLLLESGFRQFTGTLSALLAGAVN